MLGADRQRDHPALLRGRQLARLDPLAVAEQLEQDLRIRQPGANVEPRGLPDLHRGLREHELERQLRRVALAGDEQLAGGLERRAERILGRVAQPVRARGERGKRDRRQPLRVVGELAVRDLRAVLPGRERALRLVVVEPARALPIALGEERARLLRLGERPRLLGGQQRALRLGEPHQLPAALARAGRAVEIEPGDLHRSGLVRGEEALLRLEQRLDRDEPEAEDALARAGLAALVGDVRREPVAVGDRLRVGDLLVRLRGEADLEAARRPRARSCHRRPAPPARSGPGG